MVAYPSWYLIYSNCFESAQAGRAMELWHNQRLKTKQIALAKIVADRNARSALFITSISLSTVVT